MNFPNPETSHSIVVPTMKAKALGSLTFSRAASFDIDIDDESPVSVKARINLKQHSAMELSTFGDLTPMVRAQPKTPQSAPVYRSSSASATIAQEAGKIKRFNEEVNKLIDTAEKALLCYGLKLIIKVSPGHSQAIYNIIKPLIPEIYMFPTYFIKNLNIKELVICEDEPVQSLSSMLKDTSFVLKRVDIQAKLLQRLYQIIFNNIFLTNPRFIKDWEKIVQSKREVLSEELASFGELLRAFVQLMMSVNFPLRKPKLEELRKLLERHYPDLSEAWFMNRAQEKKKMVKVCFDLSA